MALSRTFTKPEAAGLFCTAVVLCGYCLLRTYSPLSEPGEDVVQINFHWERSASPEMLDEKITSVVENWLSSMPDIAQISSETHKTTGRITLFAESGANISSLVSRIRMKYKMMKHQLPEDISDLQILHQGNDKKYKLQIATLLPDPLKQKFLEHLFAHAAVTRVELSDQRNEVLAFPASKSLRDWLDSASTDLIRQQSIDENLLIRNKGWNFWLSGNTWIHHGLIAETISTFKPQTRINGRPYTSIKVSYQGNSASGLAAHVKKWPHFKSHIILLPEFNQLRGINVPLIIFLLILMMLLSLIDFRRGLKDKLLNLSISLFLTACAFLIWDYSVLSTDDLAFMMLSLIGGLFMAQSQHGPLRSTLINTIPILFIIALPIPFSFIPSASIMSTSNLSNSLNVLNKLVATVSGFSLSPTIITYSFLYLS